MLTFVNVSKLFTCLLVFTNFCSAMNEELPFDFADQVLEQIDDGNLFVRQTNLENLSLVNKYNHLVICRWRVITANTNFLNSIPSQNVKMLSLLLVSAYKIPIQWLDGLTRSKTSTIKEVREQIIKTANRSLAYFARDNQVAAFDKLILAGANPNASLSDDDSRTAFYLAMQEGNINTVVLLLSLPNTNVNSKDAYDRTPLMLAETGSEDGMKALELLLTDDRLEINAQDNHGCSALHKTINPALIFKLVGHPKIDLTIKDNSGRTPIHSAACGGHVVSLMYILGHAKCDIHERTQGRGDTALHEAAQFAQPQAMKMLVEKGCNINLANNYGETPLQCAVMSSYMKQEQNPNTLIAVQFLLDLPEIDIEKVDVLELANRHSFCPHVKAIYDFLLLHPKFAR